MNFVAAGNGKVRPAAKKLPCRQGEIWATVTIIQNEKAYTTSPELICIDCHKRFAGGVSRIKAHIVKQCTCNKEEVKELKKELLKELVSRDEGQKRKMKQEDVDRSAADDYSSPIGEGVPKSSEPQQVKVSAMFNAVTSEIMDQKVADLVYGQGLPFSFVESPQFKSLLNAARNAPPSYKPPNQVRMAGL